MEVSREVERAVACAESAIGAYEAARAAGTSAPEGGASALRVSEVLEVATAELWAAADALNLAREVFTRQCLDECGEQLVRQQHAGACDTWKVLFGLLAGRPAVYEVPITSFQSVIAAQSAGTADVEELAGAFDKLAASINKASAVDAHPELGEFAEKVRAALENPMREPGRLPRYRSRPARG